LNKGQLILIPVPIAEDNWHSLPTEVFEHTEKLKFYYAENARTARRILRGMHPTLKLEDVQIEQYDKHKGWDMTQLKSWIRQGFDVGVMSESGCPAIADPGADLVRWAQENETITIPLSGPNSILLGLMGSGFNGQCFCFRGYLPINTPERTKELKRLEQISSKENQTQIFIETPYRNQTFFEILLKTLQPKTRLSIAIGIGSKNGWQKTKTISDWKKESLNLNKTPAVFLFLA